MLKFLKRLILFACIVALGYGAYVVYTQTNLFKITSITFTAHETMDLKTIEQYAQLKKGNYYLSVNAGLIEEKLRAHPYVQAVEVKKTFPNKVHLDIAYRTHDFNLYYSDIVLSLDEHLVVLGVLDEPKDGYTVEGFSFDSYSVGMPVQVEKRYVLENIVMLIDLMEESKVEADKTILYKDDSIVVTIGEMKVRFGIGDNLENKYNAFINIFEALKRDGITSGTIDVSSDGLPVFRPFGE